MTHLSESPAGHENVWQQDTASRGNRFSRIAKTAWHVLWALLLISLFAVRVLDPPHSPAAEPDVTFENAAPGRVLTFPKDHGKHPEFQTEWWYFTGNLESQQDRRWGFELTFFRRGLTRQMARAESAWRVLDLYPAHFAVTDVQNRKFFFSELLSREGPGLAGASLENLGVWVKDWSAELRSEQIHIRARADGCSLELALRPLKPVVLHGQGGYSRKSDREKQASYYYSFTRLDARGSLTLDGKTHPVTGLAWMDHEFGSSLLAEDQAGWDWFSLQLDDGTDLMLFQMRRKDGTFEPPVGTVVDKDGTGAYVRGREISISPSGSWTSPHTKAVYPSGWTIEIPGQNTKLAVVPLVQDQELASGKSTGIVYWEGAVGVRGSSGGRAVQGYGYVELTGYAHSMAGRL